MIGSNKKYVDPTDVVKAICDDFGNHLPIGD
jgi:ubiquitin carboxyl-terminal hydrolase 25/28